jgi:F-type H+-transporting ATPase subunit alpha
MSIGERLRDRGFDTTISFDDFSKHSKSYRQISLILAKIPSRDAFPSDIFNIHASILERCGKLKICYFSGSISAFPIIETIANDITEYIATNIISITDGQLYTNKKLFLSSCRPSIDSSLSVSRI